MKSQTPTWAIVVAILMMLNGGCGISNDLQSINIDKIVQMKDKVLDGINKSKNQSESDAEVTQKANDTSDMQLDDNEIAATIEDTVSAEAYFKSNDSLSDEKYSGEKELDDLFSNFIDLSEDTIHKIKVFGYTGLFFSVILILAGLFLFIKKSYSIKLVYTALILNILFVIIKWVIISGEGGMILSVSNSIGSTFSIIMLGILTIVVFSSDKSHYDDNTIN